MVNKKKPKKKNFEFVLFLGLQQMEYTLNKREVE